MSNPLTTINEQKLVQSVLQNDRKAILQMIHLYERLVTAMVFKMVDSPADREDMCQDVFLKIFSHLKTFKFNCKLSTWIAQITYNTCLNYLQKKKTLLLDDVFVTDNKDEEEPSSYVETITLNFMQQTTATPYELLQQTETVAHLQEAIEQLPILFRTLVQLYHIEEVSYTEIAQITKLPLNTVKSYLFRSRKMLKNFLQSSQFIHR